MKRCVDLTAITAILLALAPVAHAEPGPTDIKSAKSALVGKWQIETKSFRKMLATKFNADGSATAESTLRLIDRMVQKSQMEIEFRQDGSMNTSSKIVVPDAERVQNINEAGTWRVVEMKDKTFTLSTTSSASDADPQKPERIQVKFETRDRIAVRLELFDFELFFTRSKPEPKK